MTKTVNIDEAQTTLSKLLSVVTSGNEEIIAKDDKPVAKIVPVGATKFTRPPYFLAAKK